MESSVSSPPVYEFATENSKALENIATWCNRRSEAGWEFLTLVVEDGRYVALFRRLKLAARCSKCGSSLQPDERFCSQCGAQQ